MSNSSTKGGSMPIMLAHACIDVRCLRESIVFYSKIGLKTVYEFKDTSGKVFGVYMKAGRGTFIEMFQVDIKLIKKFKASDYFHLCFQVKNLKAAESSARKNRIKITKRISWGKNGKLLFIKDPDGNTIELLQYLKENPLLKHMK